MTGRTPSGRRFLLAGAVSHYRHDLSWDREELAGDLRQMIELFTGELGYEHLPLIGLDPTSRQIQDALRDFCTSDDRRPDDYLTVYLAGHGEILDVGTTGSEHVLLPADAHPGDLRRRAIKSADLAEWMLAETAVCRLLLIVDACYAGRGGLDFARNALARVGSPAQLGRQDGSGVVVVTATQPAQQAVAGAFTAAFIRAVRNQATAGHGPESLTIPAVMGVIRADPQLPASQQAQWSLLAGSGAVPDFLPNPRSDAALVDLDLAEQERLWGGRLDYEHRRSAEMRDHFAPRIAGFTGRHRVLARLCGWLSSPADAKPVVITGDPGSGKTAVLGLLAALSDPRRRSTVPRDGLPTDAIPPTDAIDVAIYAGNLTAGEVLAGLAAAVGIGSIESEPDALSSGLVSLLSALRQGGRPLTAIIDAVDEAADPADLAGQLLRPLIDQGEGAIRLLLGTRRHVCDHLGRGWRDRCELLDLDKYPYADPVALATVVGRILLGAPPAAPGTPFAGAMPALLAAVTAAITAAAGHSFFVARIVAATQASLPVPPDPADLAWRASLPSAAGPAMRRDLEARLGDQAGRAVDLLLPLAYTHGTGLPWEDIWALVANALTPGHGYTNEDLLWLADCAGSFIVEGDALSGRSVYRLCHRSLAEDLSAGRDQAADEHAISSRLAAQVPRDASGHPDWPASHPYIRAHLATHAARGGGIDDLAQDPGFLLAADRSGVVTALAAAGPRAHAAAAAYRMAVHHFDPRWPESNPSYLELAAYRTGAATLVERLARARGTPPWHVAWADLTPGAEPVVLGYGAQGVDNISCTTSPDGTPIAVTGDNQRAPRIWNLSTLQMDGMLSTDGDVVHFTRALTCAALPDGTPVAVIVGNFGTTVWNLATQSIIGELGVGHWPGAVACGALRDGTPVAATCESDHVRVWSLTSRKVLHDFRVFSLHVACTKLPDGRAIAITGDGRIWNLETGRSLGRRILADDGVAHLGCLTLPSGAVRVIVVSPDGIARLWRLTAKQISLEKTFDCLDSPRMRQYRRFNRVRQGACVTRPDGTQLLVVLDDVGILYARSLPGGEPYLQPMQGHALGASGVACAVLPGGEPAAVTAGYDGTVRLWNLEQLRATPAAVGANFSRVGYTRLRADAAVAVAATGGTLRGWDAATGRRLRLRLRIGKLSRASVFGCARLVDGTPVALVGDGEGSLRAWDLADKGREYGRWQVTDRPITGLSVVTAGTTPLAVTCDGSTSIQISELTAQGRRRDPLRCPSPVGRLATAVLPDGTATVVASGDSGEVRVWDLQTGKPLTGPAFMPRDVIDLACCAELDGTIMISVVCATKHGRGLIMWNTRDPANDLRELSFDADRVASAQQADGNGLFAMSGRGGQLLFFRPLSAKDSARKNRPADLIELISLESKVNDLTLTENAKVIVSTDSGLFALQLAVQR